MSNENAQAPLAFADMQSGMDYLNALPLANPLVAQQKLMAFLDALLASPPDPGILLRLLEQARVPLSFVEDEMARRYHNRALPLGDEEENYFQQVLAAWRKMEKAYALCARLEEPDTDNPQYSVLVATILHRCLYYAGMVILEHYRARRELPAGAWLDLHGYYETAEEWGVAYTPVEDTLENNLQATHCTAAYATVLLVDLASPYSNSVRDLGLIRRWAGMWSPLVSVHRLDQEFEVPAYIVNLMKDAPLHPAAVADEPGDDARRLDTTRLALQIDHMQSQLRLRITATQLGLGDTTSGQAMALLGHLSRPWSQSASPRRFRRFASSGSARVAIGFDAMHFCVIGKEFTQPDSASAYSRGEYDQLFTFRERVDPNVSLNIKPQVCFPVDDWEVINHSANGFRLGRSSAGQRISHGQLLAVCPHDGEHFLLAQVCWLMQEQQGGLIAGIAMLPGMPKGIGVRPLANGTTTADRFMRAFLLPGVAAIKEEDSIVLPAGMYQASRILEIFTEEGIAQLRMNHVLQRGSDFDRVSYQLV